MYLHDVYIPIGIGHSVLIHSLDVSSSKDIALSNIKMPNNRFSGEEIEIIVNEVEKHKEARSTIKGYEMSSKSERSKATSQDLV